MKYAALATGLLAVFFYMLGYLQKKKGHILLLNLIARLLFILQYIMLGAFSGAVLDVAGAIATVVAGKKETPFIKRHLTLTVILLNVLIMGSGVYVILLTHELLGVLSVAGVLFHVNAFWFDREKTVRRLSMLGSPFWLAYNLLSGAYGSCVGDILSMVSIGISMYRFDRKKSEE